jgi:hypothetical protein
MRLDVMQRVKNNHAGSDWYCVLLCGPGFLISAKNFEDCIWHLIAPGCWLLASSKDLLSLKRFLG